MRNKEIIQGLQQADLNDDLQTTEIAEFLHRLKFPMISIEYL